MQTRSLSILSQQTISYTTTNAWENVPQFIITVPEEGDYDITAQCDIDCTVNVNRGAYIRLAVNGNPLPVIMQAIGLLANVRPYTPINITQKNVALKAGDVVSMQAIYTTGATIVYQSSGVTAGAFQIIKRGL